MDLADAVNGLSSEDRLDLAITACRRSVEALYLGDRAWVTLPVVLAAFDAEPRSADAVAAAAAAFQEAADADRTNSVGFLEAMKLADTVHWLTPVFAALNTRDPGAAIAKAARKDQDVPGAFWGDVAAICGVAAAHRGLWVELAGDWDGTLDELTEAVAKLIEAPAGDRA